MRIEGEEPVELRPGMFVNIPVIWLAIHYG